MSVDSPTQRGTATERGAAAAPAAPPLPGEPPRVRRVVRAGGPVLAVAVAVPPLVRVASIAAANSRPAS
ncbi:hypothetical protein [Streptomyces corynorhini]|uniref:Uncharacterized protein n=1 Tax=Streptomyces corynorhini TaxID=2282652 RepID=A0A370AVL7_9ACTN|nr:hypothetical protein [Streptomyces corynorhini]RDG31713.1 hypothetical protein DVH02_33140 [Streptomyces corynorhini]